MSPVGAAGRIGPNAITRVEAALTARLGLETCQQVFARAGLMRHLANPPTEMVPEADVMRLHAELHRALPEADAAAVAAEAGRQTAAYLLRVRIPRAAQLLLRLLPRSTAAWLFTRAIARHAWTFGGTGRFSATRDAGGLVLLIEDNPACRAFTADQPSCHYFVETFRGLYAAILGETVRVVETGCEAAGADACRFRVTWR
jgi:divinyl protochlorophyllide a 8-vinyl-reductase